MDFFVGLERIAHLHRFQRVFVSVNAIRNRKSDIVVNDWILDSGAFTELSTHGRYRHGIEEYAKSVNRWRTCGNMLAAVSQDYMCEPYIVSKTGLSVQDHQRLTIERYDGISVLCPNCYIMPVLQGFKPVEYLDHLRDYGKRLQKGAWIGVGSVCKRNSHPAMIEYILRGIKKLRPDLRLHGFGLKITATNRPEIRSMLHSSDSMAWCFAARKQGRDPHDWREAEDYRQKVDNQMNVKMELWDALTHAK